MNRDDPLTEKLETLARLSASLSHKLSNHLTYVVNYLFLLKSRSPDDETTDLVEKAEQGVIRIKNVLHELVDISDPRVGPLEDIELCSFIESALAPLWVEIGEQGIRVDISCPQPSVARTDRNCLATVISCLVRNAAEAYASEIHISVHGEHGQSAIRIEDNGSGMDAAEFERVSEPFVSGRPGSLGLGLSRSIFILHSLGGTVACRARPKGGTELRLTVPSGG
jgi:signal transduction histidine kinase